MNIQRSALRYLAVPALLLAAALPPRSASAAYDPALVRARAAVAPSQASPHLTEGAAILGNGGFELNGGPGSNSFLNWTVVSLPGSVSGLPGAGDWLVQTGATSPTNVFAVASPTEGSFAAMTDQTGPGAHVLYQDFAVPFAGIQLSCDVYVLNSAVDYVNNGTLDFEGTPNQYARADLMDPAAPIDDLGAGVLQNLFLTLPGDPLEIGYTTITADLTAFTGTTVRLRFAEADNQLYFNFGVDNCTTIGEPAQEIPTLAGAGLVALALLMLLAAVVAIHRRRAA